MENKPFTKLSSHVADEVMLLEKEMYDLFIFPEKATKEKLNQLHCKISRLINPANRLVSTVSFLEEANNMIIKKATSIENHSRDVNYFLESNEIR